MAQIQLIEAVAYAQARSTTEVAIATGIATWTLARPMAFAPGMTVTADAGGGNAVSGTVTTYDPEILRLKVDVDTADGSGSHSDWLIGGDRTFLWSSGRGYIAGTQYWEPRLRRRVAIERRLSREAASFGAGSIGFGTIDLVNARLDTAIPGRPLDALRGLAWDGRALTILSVDEQAGIETAAVIARGTAERMVYPDRDTARLLWRDPMALLDVPVLDEDWEGTTIGAGTGTTGGEEMAGVRKQLCLGRVGQQEPQLANASLNLFFASLSEMDLDRVTIVGAEQSAGTGHGSLSALVAATVASGTFDWYAGAAGTWFRCGSAVTGPVRFSGAEGAAPAERTLARVWSRLLTDWGGLDATVAAGDLTALDVQQDGECGLLVAGDMTFKQAADLLAAGGGADYWQDLDGVWRIRRLAAPAGEPQVRLRRLGPGVVAAEDEIEILDWSIPPADGLPPTQVTLRWGRQAPQTRAELAGIALEEAAALGAEWREASHPAEPDPAIADRHRLAERRSIDTGWADAATAAEEAERIHTLLADGWLPLDLTVREADIAGRLEPGAVLAVHLDRHGLAAGAAMVLRGYATVPETRTVVVHALGFGI